MITEKALNSTNISLSYTLQPVSNIICDLSAILGRNSEELISAFYPPRVSKKANIVITELVDNVLENINYKNSEINVELAINSDKLYIKVRNKISTEQYNKVNEIIDKINSSENVKSLLKETIYSRRNKNLKGGLGLIRLVAENKFNISVNYEEEYMTVLSEISLGGLV